MLSKHDGVTAFSTITAVSESPVTAGVVWAGTDDGNLQVTRDGGATFVWPFIQDYTFMSLEPITIDIDLTSALSKKNIRVNVPTTFTIGISTDPDIMNNAAERPVECTPLLQSTAIQVRQTSCD